MMNILIFILAMIVSYYVMAAVVFVLFWIAGDFTLEIFKPWQLRNLPLLSWSLFVGMITFCIVRYKENGRVKYRKRRWRKND